MARFYFDHNATTPVSPEVLQAMNAGTPIPEVKSAFPTVQLMRELLGYPALPQPAPKAPAAAPAR